MIINLVGQKSGLEQSIGDHRIQAHDLRVEDGVGSVLVTLVGTDSPTAMRPSVELHLPLGAFERAEPKSVPLPRYESPLVIRHKAAQQLHAGR